MSTFCGIVDCVENACYLNFCKDTLKLRAGCDQVNDSVALCEKHYNDFINFFTIRYNNNKEISPQRAMYASAM